MVLVTDQDTDLVALDLAMEALEADIVVMDPDMEEDMDQVLEATALDMEDMGQALDPDMEALEEDTEEECME